MTRERIGSFLGISVLRYDGYLGAKFNEVRCAKPVYAKNDNKPPVWHLTDLERTRLLKTLYGYSASPDIYRVDSAYNYCSLRKMTNEKGGFATSEGIVYVVKQGVEGFLPRYSIAYGKSGPGETTINFDEAHRLVRAHLNDFFSESFKASGVDLKP